ncbi:MAG TPA: prepilin-type N-terminal cleavage/methylation domain-containing protein [Thermoanaerobaculia bacterium]|jgi:general secretion pathway protein G
MKKRESGFTLIELLIVIAIIGILAAIAIPNLLNAVQRGKQKRSMSDMRTVATAVEAYAVDNNTYPPAACTGQNWTTTEVQWTATNSQSLLVPTYITNPVRTDGWSNAFYYGTDTVFQQYCIVSFGRDKSSSGITCVTTTNFNSDIVYSNGSFIQYPEGAQN